LSLAEPGDAAPDAHAFDLAVLALRRLRAETGWSVDHGAGKHPV
jgi:hypothetical protein